MGLVVVFLIRRVGESPQHDSDAAENKAVRGKDVVTVVDVGEGEKRREDRGEDRNWRQTINRSQTEILC